MDDLLHLLALTFVPNVGIVHANELLKYYGNAKDIFAAKKSELSRFPGIGTVRSESIKTFADFYRAEQEINFIDKYKIQVLAVHSTGYPPNLLSCPDAPTLLFYRGNIPFNKDRHIVSIVGTRNNTEYGKELTQQIVEELKEKQIIITSGLAYGIDSIAHKTAVKQSVPTVGIIAHGLDRIYPSANKSLAKDMLQCGGLLTEFLSGTQPDKQNFPKRNRIVAGICDALVVIETDVNGGSIITAELANQYNKDVFAFPGKVSASRSAGCHQLIRSNKAALITSGKDLVEMMNWDIAGQNAQMPKQQKLFIDFTEDEAIIVRILEEKDLISIDELKARSGISNSKIAASLLKLEMEGHVLTMPGKLYKLT